MKTSISVIKAKLKKDKVNEAYNWLSKSASPPLCFTEVGVSGEEYDLLKEIVDMSRKMILVCKGGPLSWNFNDFCQDLHILQCILKQDFVDMGWYACNPVI